MRLGAIALALLVPIAACTAFEAGDGASSPGTASDGGTPPDGSTPSDAGTDVTCTLLVDDAFESADAGWQLVGAAAIDGGRAVLTPDAQDQAGAMWMHVDPPATGFQAAFELRHATATSPDAAHGIAFAWSSNETTPPIGSAAAGLGLCASLTEILGLAFDESHDQIELRDARSTSCADKPRGTSWSSGSAPQTGLVSLTGGAVQATAGSKLFNEPLPSAFPIRWLGFTASTGKSYAEHTVDSVKIKVCR
jgi:hypothetical protein